jgi:L-rhamnose mutarotase
MAKMAADPATQEWWKLTDPCQQSLADRAPDEWWADMKEVCHHCHEGGAHFFTGR